jgi:hypothetical protein
MKTSGNKFTPSTMPDNLKVTVSMECYIWLRKDKLPILTLNLL